MECRILLDVPSARRPTKDVDMNAFSSCVTADSLAEVFAAIAGASGDGITAGRLMRYATQLADAA